MSNSELTPVGSSEPARSDPTGLPTVERKIDDAAWFAKAKGQAEDLVASGVETARRLAREAGEEVDADVVEQLRRIHAEAFEAVCAFAAGRYEALSASAKSTLAEAARWALARIDDLEARLETKKDHLVIRRIANAELGNKEIKEFVEIATSLRDFGLEENEGVIKQWLDTVWRKGATKEHFSALLTYWRTLPGDSVLSRRLARRLVQQYGERVSDAEGSFDMEPRTFLSVAPDLYLAGQGSFSPGYVIEERGSVSLFNKVRESGNAFAMARFEPFYFDTEDFVRVKGDLFRAYVETRSNLLFAHLASFETELRALPPDEREEAIEWSIEGSHISPYHWPEAMIGEFVSERHVRAVVAKLKQQGVSMPLLYLSQENRHMASLVPKIANVLGVTPAERAMALSELIVDNLDFFQTNLAHFELSDAEKRRVDGEIAEWKRRDEIRELRDRLAWESEDTKSFAVSIYRRMAMAGKNANEYFLDSGSADDGDMGASGGDWNVGTRTRVLEAVFHSELRPFAESILDDYSPKILKAFVERASGIGINEAANHFLSREREWRMHPENRFAILEEFFVDRFEAARLAVEKMESALESGEPIELPESGEGIVAVELEIPSLRYDPSWYDQGRIPVHAPADDEVDYRLPSVIVPIENLKKHTFADVRALHRAMMSGDHGGMGILVERLVGLGEIPPDKLERIVSGLQLVSNLWNGMPFADDAGRELAGRLRSVESERPVGGSADAFVLRHELFGKERRIASFIETLRAGPLTELALAHAVHFSRLESFDPWEVASQVIYVEAEARRMYADVVRVGVPVFRDFIAWLNEEHRKRGAGHEGEFYVGRDTLSTLHLAAVSTRWGNVPGGERRKLTVHVDVSGNLLSNLMKGDDATDETRAMLRAWLEQEGVTERMLGIDGGYKGSSPAGVFEALSGTSPSPVEMNQKIRLVESSSYPDRRFNPREVYNGVVLWMEALPKFTERSNSLSRTEFGKYYVVSERRSPAERALAWTVRQAVWRELVERRSVTPSPPPA